MATWYPHPSAPELCAADGGEIKGFADGCRVPEPGIPPAPGIASPVSLAAPVE
ncbi:hypothetical protein [Streptomyces sp. NPDC093544]|uniref:hypothetical protein n=1 Tax=Streptomyces sp. NPDC093544 TaxID=3155200 RepID=UPI0034178C35